MKAPKFEDKYIVCSKCGFKMHVYCYPFVDRDEGSRDTNVCLLCLPPSADDVQEEALAREAFRVVGLPTQQRRRVGASQSL